MTGSVLDGEDIVQEALFEAYRKLDTFDDRRTLARGCSGSPQSLHRFPERRGTREDAKPRRRPDRAVARKPPALMSVRRSSASCSPCRRRSVPACS